MSSVIDSYIAKGREEGRREGRAEGRAEGRREGREEGREEARKRCEIVIAEKDREMDRMARELRELKARYGLA